MSIVEIPIYKVEDDITSINIAILYPMAMERGRDTGYA